jgi:hypothetical protein
MNLAIMEYNIVKLDLNIKNIINPILKAVYEYEKRVSNIKKEQEGKKDI